MPIPRVRATAFQEELTSGATSPCVFGCESDAGVDVGEYVVKFRSTVRGGATGLLFEAVTAQLAVRLGLSTPEPAIAELSAALADATPDRRVAQRILDSLGSNFATRRLDGYPTCPVDWVIPAEQKSMALEIMAFDALIDNSDRRRDKPNMLIGRNEIRIIDHELAYSFVRLLGVRDSDLNFDALQFLRQHPFYPGLARTRLDLDRFCRELCSITVAELREMFEAVPADFGREFEERIIERIKLVQEKVDFFAACIRRVLNGS